MKYQKSLFLLLAALLLTTISCGKIGSSDWAVKIDNDVISMDEFNKLYYTQNKLLLRVETDEEVDKMAANAASLNPQYQQYLVKSNFLDHIIAQKLLYKKALADGDINQDNLETIIEIAKMQAVATYYLGLKLKDQIGTPSEEEVEAFYNQNRRLFKGVPLNDAVIDRIKQQIFMQKSQLKSNEYIMSLMAESKVNKEGFKKHMKDQKKEAKEEVKEEKKDEAPKAE